MVTAVGSQLQGPGVLHYVFCALCVCGCFVGVSVGVDVCCSYFMQVSHSVLKRQVTSSEIKTLHFKIDDYPFMKYSTDPHRD